MKISKEALKAGQAIANYCLTRFPSDTPPSELIDVPWFAEKVQIAIDAAIAEREPKRGACGIWYHHADCDCGGVGGER